MKRKRILIAKMGMDGHDVGLKVIAQTLRNTGFEVIYLGPYQTPEMVVKTAVQEAADIIAIGSHSGEYNFFVPPFMRMVKEELSNQDVKVILGGLIGNEDIPKLKEMGVDKVFPIGTSLQELMLYVQSA